MDSQTVLDHVDGEDSILRRRGHARGGRHRRQQARQDQDRDPESGLEPHVPDDPPHGFRRRLRYRGLGDQSIPIERAEADHRSEERDFSEDDPSVRGAEESLPSPDEQERQDDAPAQDEGDRVRRHPGEAAQDDPRERRRLRIPEEAPDRHDSREAAEPEADATEVRRIRRDPDSGEDRRGGGMGADAAGDDRGDGEEEGGLDRPTGFLRALRPGLRERAAQEDEQARPQGDPDRDGLEIWGGEEPLGGRRAITVWEAGWTAFESGREG